MLNKLPVKATFASAIARQEGFWVEGSLANRRNNPGNIEEGKFAQSHGALPSDGNRFAAWATADEGFAALVSLLKIGYTGLTLAQAIAKWAPANENDTAQHIKNVSSWTGLDPETVLTAETLTVA